MVKMKNGIPSFSLSVPLNHIQEMVILLLHLCSSNSFASIKIMIFLLQEMVAFNNTNVMDFKSSFPIS